ncbi:MlaD family protein [Sulfurimonas sp.]|uniref:MlaD family protein n=1 Tax=Sulfurimonas sp. TaxID=2022749 RepID=UPI003567FD38
MQYDKIKIIVGIFVLVLLVTITSFLYMVMDEKGTFNKRYTFHFNTASAESFHVGMPLKFSGFNIGVIDLMKLRSNGSVKMEFSVPEENKKWITKDSVLIIKKPLIGASHIELYSAFDNPLLEDGGELMLIMNDDINDMVDKLHPLIDKVISIVTNVDKITKKLSSNDSLLTSLTGSEQTSKDFQKILQSLAVMMDDIKKITKNLDKDIVSPASSAVGELDKILKDVNQKLKDLDGTVKAVGSFDTELEDIKTQISSGLQKSNELMDKVDAILVDEKNFEVKLP